MRPTTRFVSVVSSVLVVAGLAACAAPMGQSAPISSYPTSYPQATYPVQVPQGNYVEYGRVSNVEVLRSQDPARGTGVGAVLGGVAGAVVGSQIGGGSGRTAATVIGAVGGAVAGNAIEKNRNTQPVNESYRISVQLDNGMARAFDVPAFGELRIGDRVKIENNQLYRIL
jgi:outer membrane lipoprotein SlyB